MAKAATVRVGYEGRYFDIPAEISEANARQPGIAAAWIEDQLEAERDRKATQKAASDLNVEREFTQVKSQLSELNSLKDQVEQQSKALEAYQAANEAQAAQIEALQATGDGLGAASSNAQQASVELAHQATACSLLLESMQSREVRLLAIIDQMEQRLEALDARQAEQVKASLKAAQTREKLQQEGTNRLMAEVARVGERIAQADGTAAEALQVAKGSRQLTKDQFTEADLLALVQSEIRLSAEQIVELVIDSLKPMFPNGFGGPRMDADYVDQTNRDRVNSNEMRVGMDEAVKATLKKAGSV